MATRRSSRIPTAATATKRRVSEVIAEAEAAKKKTRTSHRKKNVVDDDEISVSSPSDDEGIRSPPPASEARIASAQALEERKNAVLLKIQAEVGKLVFDLPKHLKEGIKKGVTCMNVKCNFSELVDDTHLQPLVDYISHRMGQEKGYSWWIYKQAPGCSTSMPVPRFFALIWWGPEPPSKEPHFASGTVSSNATHCAAMMTALAKKNV